MCLEGLIQCTNITCTYVSGPVISAAIKLPIHETRFLVTGNQCLSCVTQVMH